MLLILPPEDNFYKLCKARMLLFPNLATSVTAIEVWLLWCIFFIFFPLLEYALVLVMARISREKWEEELRAKNKIFQVRRQS
jgi:hypothetical protein